MMLAILMECIHGMKKIYHFEKYNMPLKQEFIDYVLTKTLD